MMIAPQMRTSSRRPTSTDVAREAGVSRTTVSYVLNGVDGQRIAEQTRARVLAAAERLGYTQNAVARTLQRGHSSVVVLALPPWPLGPPVAEAVGVICRDVSALGYTPLVMIEPSNKGTHLVRACHEVQPVGVIAPSVNFQPGVLTQVCASGARAVISYGDSAVPGTYSLIGTQDSVGACAVEYLLRRGHRDVLGVVPASGELAEMGKRRSAGARAVCRAGGARYRSVATPFERLALGAALDHAVSVRRPDAIFAFNDEAAFMVIRHLVDSRYRVPDDVAVIGCDDSPVAALFQPSLTSVRAFWTSLAEPLRALLSGELLTGSGDWLNIRVVPRDSA
jgi:DNA-binding LacI/PurR family transcriptional regulator